MATPYCLEMLVFPLFLATSLLYQLSDALIELKADQALVLDNICKQAEEYSFCFSTLKADPRTAVADQHGLALISIAINIDIVQSTSDRILVIVNNITDPVDKQRIEVCQTDYRDALEKFRGAYKSSSERSYREVIDWLRDGANKVIDCEDIYRRSPPIRESPTTGENHQVIKLAEITLIVIDPLIST